jgi:hypothetical protein
LTALISLLVKKTSSSCGVAGRFGNRTLPFSQHSKNYELLLLDFVNHSLIHIFALQNSHIVSISPQSHCIGADVSSSPINFNVSSPIEGCAHATACCTVRRSQHKRLFCYCSVSDGLANSRRCLARRFLCKQLWRSSADSDVSWLNYTRTLICGTRFSKKQDISAHPHHLGNTKQMIMFHHPNTTFFHIPAPPCSLDWTLTINVVHLQLVGNLALFFLSCLN